MTAATVEKIRVDATDAYVVEPAAARRRLPGIAYAHGGRQPGKHLLLGQGVELALAGFTVVLADVSVPGPSDDAEAEEQAVATALAVHRRSLDALEARGATRFGFFGHSFGGTQAALLATDEPRLEAVVIASTGSGLVEWLRDRGSKDEEYLARMDRLDPVHFVGAARRSRLLFQHGRRDEVIPLAAGRALFDAAAEPKEWREYDCGHGVDGHLPALADRIAFFREVLAT